MEGAKCEFVDAYGGVNRGFIATQKLFSLDFRFPNSAH